jgi:SM-20-related protein
LLNRQFVSELKQFPDLFSKNKYWHCKSVFTDDCLKDLLTSFEQNQSNLRPAMIGKGLKKRKAQIIRNDLITWLERSDDSFNALWSLLDQFKIIMRQDLFIPIKRYESQIALYPPGHFYLKHVDRHQLSPSRVFTFVLYLNEWSEGDGGELNLYLDKNDKITIKPILNEIIIFASELEHEVLVANKNRKSITAWFRNDIL